MNLVLQSRSFAQVSIGLAYLVIGFLGWSLALVVPNLEDRLPPCLFHHLTGIPCPACGATHSGLYLSRVQLREAFWANPFFFFVYLALAAWGLNSLLGVVFGKNVQIVLRPAEKIFWRRSVWIFILINWLFMILRTLLTEPTLSY